MTEVVGLALGVFDLFHRGHLEFLRIAANNCGRLVVGVQEDRSVLAGKGSRPVFQTADRMEIVRALKFVGDVFSYAGDDHISLIDTVDPGVLIVGPEFGKDQRFPSQTKTLQHCHDQAIEVVVVPRWPGVSSTWIRESAAEFWKSNQPANVTQKFDQKIQRDEVGMIGEAIQRANGTWVVQLGAGRGRLTKPLAKKYSSHIFEACDMNVDNLTEIDAASLPNVASVCLDVCDDSVDWQQMFTGADVFILEGICPYVDDDSLDRVLASLVAAVMPAGRIVFREPMATGDEPIQVVDKMVPELGRTYSAIYRPRGWFAGRMGRLGWRIDTDRLVVKHHDDSEIRVVSFRQD